MTTTEKIDQFIAENGGDVRDALNVALARLELLESKQKQNLTLFCEEIRQAFVDYYMSEGCSCCENTEEHKKAEVRLGELLEVNMYKDGSGYNWNELVTKKDC